MPWRTLLRTKLRRWPQCPGISKTRFKLGTVVITRRRACHSHECCHCRSCDWEAGKQRPVHTGIDLACKGHAKPPPVDEQQVVAVTNTTGHSPIWHPMGGKVFWRCPRCLSVATAKGLEAFLSPGPCRLAPAIHPKIRFELVSNSCSACEEASR